MLYKRLKEKWNHNFPEKMMHQLSRDVEHFQYNKLFELREKHIEYIPHAVIKQMYLYIQRGQVGELVDYFEQDGKPLLDYLDKVGLREAKEIAKYQVGMVTYLTIDAGLPEPKAYTMLSAYQLFTENAKTVNDIKLLYINASIEYANKMAMYGGEEEHSKQVVDAINYIEYHLHEKIAIKDIADEVYLSSRHLSRKFQQEIGCSILEYVNTERLEEAKYLLALTELSSLEISNYLAYSSESYFINVFKKYYGCSPTEYRRKAAMKE